MGQTLEALLKLQSVERQLGQVQRRLETRSGAVDAQQARLAECQQAYDTLHNEVLSRQSAADSIDLQVKECEQRIEKLRGDLNNAKTNKEYATLLTEINTLKADNSKAEDEALAIMGDVDEVRARAEEAKAKIAEAEEALEEVKRTSAEEIAKLEGMVNELQGKRDAAAKDVPAAALEIFTRIASMRDGEAMAPIEIHGSKPPHEYICGGCFMSVTAEHANALRTRDDLRFCDSCGRILFLEEQASALEA